MTAARVRIIGGKFWLRVDHSLVAEAIRRKRLLENMREEVRSA